MTTKELPREVIQEALAAAQSTGRPVRVMEERAANLIGAALGARALVCLLEQDKWSMERIADFEVQCRAIVWPNGIVS